MIVITWLVSVFIRKADAISLLNFFLYKVDID